MDRLATADWSETADSGLTCYLWEIRRFPMMEPHKEYVLGKRWREHGDHEAAHKLVNSQFTPRRQDRQGVSRLRPADL
jgi:DNA-directed RNA polymerase sigma subunit (sigma70/sigma32)